MRRIANLLFETAMLKNLPRSGYQFLGTGRESVAEHTFITTFIAFVMARMDPEIDAERLLSMCLVHDLAEARTGDLNYVNRRYVTADEERAVDDLTSDLPFGGGIRELVSEFNRRETPEARLARDADQLAFIVDLKALSDIGHRPPESWMPAVMDRLDTETGRRLGRAILETPWDAWWRKIYVDRSEGKD